MVEEIQSSNRKLVTILAIGALLLALVAGIVVVALVLGGDSGEGAETAESAKLMPEDTFMFMAFNPHLDQAKNYQVIEQAWVDHPLVKKGLAEFLDSMKEDGLDYTVDIEPWLGNEIAFGMGPGFVQAFSGQMSSAVAGVEGALAGDLGQSPELGDVSDLSEFVVAIATTDTAESGKFLRKLRAEAQAGDVSWQEEEYKGVNITYSKPQSEGDVGMAYATVDNFVVLAVGGLETMQAVIDTKGGSNLGDNNENYKGVLDKLPADQIGYGYVDIGSFSNVMLEALSSELADLPSDLFNLDQIKAFKGAGFSIGLESNGLRMDFVTVYDKDLLPDDAPGTQASSGILTGRVPAAALLFISSNGLGNAIQTGLDAIQAMPDQPEDLDEQLQMVTALLGVSVDELIEMLSGDFALAITHDSAGIGGDPSMPIGAGFLLATEHVDKFERLLNSLSTLLALGAEMEFPKETINDVEVTTIADPSSGNMIAGWGVGEGVFAIGTSRELLTSAFGGNGDVLSAAATYKAVMEPLPKDKTGVFYVNLSALLGLADEVMGASERESFAEFRGLVSPVKAIGAASEPYDKGKDSAAGTVFILIDSD